MVKLTIRDSFPVALEACSVRGLARHLPGPTLFDLPGHAGRPLFVSVLLHGNEDTGFEAIKQIMARYRKRGLPRPLLLFVGNIAAAAAGVRTLPEQRDYNRVWPGTPFGDSMEARLMLELVEYVRQRQPFASLDIHNNTGLNPHYGCVNRLDEAYLHLARLFSRTVVYFTEPVGVQSLAMADICPAVTVECGKAGIAANTAHAVEFIDACLHLSAFPSSAVPEHDLQLLRTGWIVYLDAAASLSFDGEAADFEFRTDLDHLNFAVLPVGTCFGRLGRDHQHRLRVVDAGGGALGEIFDYQGGQITLRRPVMPAMLTRDHNAVRLDCLCYLMQPIARDGRPLPQREDC